MVRQDHVRGLALFDERADGAVDGMKLGFRKVDALPGRRAELLVKALCDLGVVVILGLYGAEVPGPVAAVADVGCAVDPVAAFPFKAFADGIALMAGTARGIADDDLVAGIHLFTTKAVDAEVIRVVEASPVPDVDTPVKADLFGDRGRILAEEAGNIPEGQAGIEAVLDVEPVMDSKVFVVSRDRSRHKTPPFSRRRETRKKIQEKRPQCKRRSRALPGPVPRREGRERDGVPFPDKRVIRGHSVKGCPACGQRTVP